MNDFNSYLNNNPNRQGGAEQGTGGINVNDVLKAIAGKYEGAGEDEIIAAIIEEAEKSRRNGTLSDGDLDNFAGTIAPMLNDKQRKKLAKVIKFLKSK